jgi:hypothetical protein
MAHQRNHVHTPRHVALTLNGCLQLSLFEANKGSDIKGRT